MRGERRERDLRVRQADRDLDMVGLGRWSRREGRERLDMVRSIASFRHVTAPCAQQPPHGQRRRAVRASGAGPGPSRRAGRRHAHEGRRPGGQRRRRQQEEEEVHSRMR